MWMPQELYGSNHLQAPIEAGEAPCEIMGEEIQRLSVVLSLPNLLEAEESSCMQRIIPKIQLALPTGSTEFHMAASSTFKTILERKLVHPRTFTQTFLQSILTSIESRDPVVASAWLETLLDVIDLLPSEVVKSDILPVAVAKGQLSQPVNNRLTACKLLGKIAAKFDPPTLKKEALPLVLSLCQDVKWEVRACICAQLSAVSKGLGPDGVKPGLLPVLVELASDEEARVRLAAVEAVVHMLPYLQPDTMKHTISPLVRKMCDAALRADDDVVLVVSKVYGALCLGLEVSLSPADKKWFLGFYQQLAQLGVRMHNKRDYSMQGVMQDTVDKHSACRHNCAYNLPAMTVFACNQSPDTFQEQLYATFCDLATDPYFVVRKTVACGLHEVGRVLGPSSCGCIKTELVRLLRDDEEEVLNGLIPNLGKTLLLLTRATIIGPDLMDGGVVEVGRSIIKCEGVVAASNDWRLHECLLEQLECIHLAIPSEFIYTHFVPMIFSRILAARQVPVRLAACRTLLVLLRYNVKMSQKNDMRSRIVVDLCNGRSCYSRMSYLRMCSFALDLFSRKYCKEHFLSYLLDRPELDPVPNNRLVLVQLLPRVKSCLRLPGDKRWLVAMETVVRRLMSGEKDRDVAAAVRTMIAQLDRIDVPNDNEKRGTRDDVEDGRRVEEEARIQALCNTRGGDKGVAANRQKGGADELRTNMMMGAGRPADTATRTQRRSLTGRDIPKLYPGAVKSTQDTTGVKNGSASGIPSRPTQSATLTVAPQPARGSITTSANTSPAPQGTSASIASRLGTTASSAARPGGTNTPRPSFTSATPPNATSGGVPLRRHSYVAPGDGYTERLQINRRSLHAAPPSRLPVRKKL